LATAPIASSPRRYEAKRPIYRAFTFCHHCAC
jgi:hypothetical protein